VAALKLLSVPLAGLAAMANVKVSPCGSVPVKVMLAAVLALVVTDCGFAVGSAITVMITLALEVRPPLSEMV